MRTGAVTYHRERAAGDMIVARVRRHIVERRRNIVRQHGIVHVERHTAWPQYCSVMWFLTVPRRGMTTALDDVNAGGLSLGAESPPPPGVSWDGGRS